MQSAMFSVQMVPRIHLSRVAQRPPSSPCLRFTNIEITPVKQSSFTALQYRRSGFADAAASGNQKDMRQS